MQIRLLFIEICSLEYLYRVISWQNLFVLVGSPYP